MEASSGVCSSGAKVSGFATRSNSPSSNESGSDGTIHAGLRRGMRWAKANYWYWYRMQFQKKWEVIQKSLLNGTKTPDGSQSCTVLRAHLCAVEWKPGKVRI